MPFRARGSDFDKARRVADRSEGVGLRIAFWCLSRSARRARFQVVVAAVGVLGQRAIGSDLLIAASAAASFVAAVRRSVGTQDRTFHVALGLYVLAAVVSAVYAADQGLASENVLLTVEPLVLALLTSVFASDSRRLPAIGWTVCFVALYMAVLAAVGLGLFYAGTDTSLIGAYGSQTGFAGSQLAYELGAGARPLGLLRPRAGRVLLGAAARQLLHLRLGGACPRGHHPARALAPHRPAGARRPCVGETLSSRDRLPRWP